MNLTNRTIYTIHNTLEGVIAESYKWQFKKKFIATEKFCNLLNLKNRTNYIVHNILVGDSKKVKMTI